MQESFTFSYSFSEILSWYKNRTFGPSKKFKNLTNFIPQSTVLNEISPKIRLGFIGDIMRMGERDLVIEDKIKNFFQNVDFLIAPIIFGFRERNLAISLSGISFSRPTKILSTRSTGKPNIASSSRPGKKSGLGGFWQIFEGTPKVLAISLIWVL